MPTLKLYGTLEEQASQLYDMAAEAMQEGRYAAAYRYLREIERALPGFRDVPERLAQANYARREQRFLAMGSMAGAIVLIIVARLLNARSEWLFLAAAVLGLAVGFFLSLLLAPRVVRRPKPPARE